MNETTIESVADDLVGRNLDAFECFRRWRRETGVNFEAGKLKSAQTNSRSGVGVRVVLSGRTAVGGTSDMTALPATINSAIDAAAFGDPFEFQLAAPAQPRQADLFDQAVAAMQVADLVAIGRRIVDRLADIAKVATVSASVDADEGIDEFVNSAGQRFNARTTGMNVSVGIEFFGNDGIFSVYDFSDSCRADADPDGLADSVRRKFELARNVVPAGPNDQPIVFTPLGLHALLVPLLAGLNGQNVADGISPLAGKLGQPLLDEKLTLIDDGTLAGRPGSAAFDDEGVPTQRTMLLDRGRVGAFLLDLRNAAKLGLASTGSASRGLTSPPAPGVTNLLLAPGDVPLDRLIGDIDDGLLVETLLGVGQGNVTGGDYANPIGLAYKISGGRIVGRVKDCSIAGNVYQDLRRIAAIEDRGHWHGSQCLPHVRIDGIELAVGG